MNKCPKVGARVRYPGGLVVGPCTGTVMAIYKSRRYAEADDDPRWDDADFIPTCVGFSPEREWHVGIKVDEIPEKWCYTGTDRFAPDVGEIEPL